MNYKPAICRFFILSLLCTLAACAGGHRPPPESGGEGAYKVGQPYKVGGSWYYPKEDYSYDETGIASWYGDDFHNLHTANGETFNKNELTAAHKTLPMPSLARITNLDNGKSIVVRVNDRGPFSGARIVDVSQRAAQLLGFEKEGTAKVRVQVMADESRAIADAMRKYGTAPTMVATAEPLPVAQGAGAPISPVTSQQLAPPPTTTTPPATQAQARAMMATFKPAPEVIQMPITSHNRIFIQAGAFTKPDNATRMKQTLAQVGQVNIGDAVIKGTKFYRVRLGPVASVAEADILLKRVTKAGAPNARIIID